MKKQDNGLKTKVTPIAERKTMNPRLTIIIIACVGVVIIGLAIATVLVATRNSQTQDHTIVENFPTADPYFFLDNPDASPSGAPTASADLPEIGWVQTGDFGSSVKVRTLPSTDSLSLTLVRDREPINILSITEVQEDTHQWYQISYNEDIGYIRDDFIVFEEPAALPDILYGVETEDVITGKKMYSKLDFLSHAAPDVMIKLTLAYDDNFIGKKMYSSETALIQYSTGEKLAKAAAALKEKGYQLVLWDAYRPYSVSEAMYKFVNDPTLLADPKKGSKHNRGAAVDVTLYRNGEPVNMPTDDRVMDVDEASRGAYMTTEQHAHLDALTDAMTDAGFITYYGEWWHFNDSDWEDYPVMDFPLSMFE